MVGQEYPTALTICASRGALVAELAGAACFPMVAVPPRPDREPRRDGYAQSRRCSSSVQTVLESASEAFPTEVPVCQSDSTRSEHHIYLYSLSIFQIFYLFFCSNE